MNIDASSRDASFRRPMIWVGIVFSAGVLLGVEFPEGRAALGIFAILFSVTVAVLNLLGAGRVVRIAAGCAIATVGAYLGARAIMPRFSPDNVVNLVGKGEITIRGRLDAYPRHYPDRTYLYVNATETINAAGYAPAEGRVRITVRKRCPRLRYGDEIEVSTRLKRAGNFNNPGAFNYERYMAAQKIFATGYVWYGGDIERLGSLATTGFAAWMQNVRQDVSMRLERLGEKRPEAQVLRALLVGDRWAVPGEVNETFSRAGVAHLLAVSGLHLGIVAWLAYQLVLWLMRRSEKLMLAIEVRRVAALVTLIPVAAYAELAGGRIPTMRAAVMVSVYLIAVAIGRSSDLHGAIALAAVLLLAIWPASITDVGFLLSFTTVIVIAEVIPVLRYRSPMQYADGAARYWERWKQNIIFGLAAGMAIVAATSPLVVRIFNSFQYLSPITNLVFIPVVGYMILPLGLGAIVLHAVSPLVGNWLLKMDIGLMEWTMRAVEWFAQAPGSGMMLPTPSVFEVVLCFVLVFSMIRLLGPPGSSRNIAKWLTAVVIIALVVDAGAWYIKQRGDAIEVAFLEAGRGDATVVSYPKGKTLLVDVGERFGNFDAGERIVGPYLFYRRVRNIDAVVITHPHFNNVGGLEWILDHFRVGEIWMADARYPVEFAERIIWPANMAEVPVKKLGKGDSFQFGDLGVDVYWPPRDYKPRGIPYSDVNAASLVFKISYEGTSFLFAGDAYDKVQPLIVSGSKSLGSTVMHAPHHGVKGSLAPRFLDAVGPRFVVVSGKRWDYRHSPDEGILSLIATSGAKTLRTDTAGAIRIRVRDGRIKVAHWTGRRWKILEKSASYK